MLENAENQKEALEKEKQEMLLGEQDLHISSKNLLVFGDCDDANVMVSICVEHGNQDDVPNGDDDNNADGAMKINYQTLFSVK